MEIHREECMKVKHIVFEEQIVGDDPEFDTPKKNAIGFGSESRTRKEETQTKKGAKIMPLTNASVPVPFSKSESAPCSNNSTARYKQNSNQSKRKSKPNPHVYIRRLTAKELQSAVGRRTPYHRLGNKSPEVNCNVNSNLSAANKTHLVSETCMQASGNPNSIVSVSLNRLTQQELDRALKRKRESSESFGRRPTQSSAGTKIKTTKFSRTKKANPSSCRTRSSVRIKNLSKKIDQTEKERAQENLNDDAQDPPTTFETVIHQPVIAVNVGLCKVKIESDYVPHIKIEPNTEGD